MNQKEIVLAGLAAANGKNHTPVQVQKMFFLFERNISQDYGGPLFDFQPYNYGPYDRTIYEVLEQLEEDGLVEISRHGRWKEYSLSCEGQTIGDKLLSSLPEPITYYIRSVSTFVRSLSFSQLVASIYHAYPEMRANSVFQE